MSSNQSAAVGLQERLNAVANGFEVPSHITTRISALVDEDVDVVDVENESNGTDYIGSAVLLTGVAVIYAAWQTPGWSDNAAGEATVTVEAWRRRDLRSVAIRPAPAKQRGEKGVNLDEQWRRANDDEWPWTGQLALTYAGRDDELCLPLNPRRTNRQVSGRMVQLTRTLMGDLGNSMTNPTNA